MTAAWLSPRDIDCRIMPEGAVSSVARKIKLRRKCPYYLASPSSGVAPSGLPVIGIISLITVAGVAFCRLPRLFFAPDAMPGPSFDENFFSISIAEPSSHP